MAPPLLTVVGNTARVSFSKEGRVFAEAIGGAGFNVAASATYSGVRPRLLSVVGTDLVQEDMQWIPRLCHPNDVLSLRGKTAHFLFEYEAEEAEPLITSDHGVASELTDHVIQADPADSWVHISCRSPLRSHEVLTWAAESQPPGISVDLMLSSVPNQFPQVREHLASIDLIFLNRAEWDVVQREVIDDGFGGKLVVTDGSRGASVIEKGRTLERIDAVPSTVHDPSAAGDAFLGTFLANMLGGTRESECLSKAAGVASLAVAGIGVSTLLEEIGMRGLA